MSPQEIEEDVETLRKSGRFRYALGAAGLLVAAVLVVYLLGRPTFDKLLGSKPRTPEAAAAKLAQARAAARLDTVAGYQQSVALAKEAVRLAGEIPYARAQAQIALADVGWADLLQARASQHQMLADGIQTTFDSTPPPGPSCCPQDEQARAGLEACKGRRPTLCTADEEIARAKALEEFEETTQKHAATVEAQERAKTAAIRDRADARVRLDDALSAARKARALDPEEVMADVAFVAYDRASGDQKAMDKVVAKIGTEHKGESIPELAREEALATDEAHKLAALEKLAGTQGDDARIHFALASQLDGHGDSDRAHAEAEKTVALSAEHEAARQLLRVLDQRARHNPPPAAVPASADPAPPKGLAQERGRE